MYIDQYLVPESRRRKALRLAHCDYSRPGPYFVTICTREKRRVLGSIGHGAIRLTEAGQIVKETWFAPPRRFPSVVLDEFAVMPNPVDGLLAFVGAGLARPGASTNTQFNVGHDRRPTLSDVVCAFKSISTRMVNRALGDCGGRNLWQRGFYEHIVRDGEDTKNIQRYILENPLNWGIDRENPNVIE